MSTAVKTRRKTSKSLAPHNMTDDQKTVVAKQIVTQGYGPGDAKFGSGMSFADAEQWLAQQGPKKWQ